MSLQQHLEYTTKKLLEEVKSRREQQLEKTRQMWDDKISKLEREYKLTIEDEVARNIAFHRFNEKRSKDDQLSTLHNQVLDQIYKKTYEKVLGSDEFLEKFSDSFVKAVKQHDLDWKFTAYGQHGKKLQHAAEKHLKGDFHFDADQKDSQGGLRATSKDMELDFSLDQLFSEVKSSTVSEVSHLIFA